MMLSLQSLFFCFRLTPGPVVHVGAHLGEESDLYQSLGFEPVCWVEAQASLLDKIRNSVSPGDTVIHAVAWSVSGLNLNFKIANNSQS